MMRRLGVFGVLFMATVLLGGCASSTADPPFAQWIERDQRNWQLTERGAIHAAGTLATTRPVAAADEIPAGAGPDDYVRLALAHNPSIIAAQHKLEGLSERIPQVTSLDDPMLQVAPIGEMAETAAGQVGAMTSISQKFPFPGKLAARGRIAGQAVAVAAQDLQQAKLNVAADTRTAYWSYYFATRAIEVTGRSRELLSQLRQVAEAKYRANSATQQDLLRASVELSNVDNELLTLHQRQVTAVAMLNSLLDRPVGAPLPEPGMVELSQVSLELDQLLEVAARNSPAIRKIHEMIEADRQKLKLARLQRYPDLTVGLTYNAVDSSGMAAMADGKDQWWIGFGINVPIWADRLRAGEREAIRGMQENIAELTGAQDRIAFRVQDSLVKVQTQQRLVLLFRDVIVPQARETVQASQSGYQAGKIDFLTLIDNWRKLLNFQLMYHQSLAQFQKDIAELQQVVGRDLPQAQPATQPAPSGR